MADGSDPHGRALPLDRGLVPDGEHRYFGPDFTYEGSEKVEPEELEVKHGALVTVVGLPPYGSGIDPAKWVMVQSPKGDRRLHCLRSHLQLKTDVSDGPRMRAHPTPSSPFPTPGASPLRDDP